MALLREKFGHLGIFDDGDVIAHRSIYPKIYCIRRFVNGFERWEEPYGAKYVQNSPIIDGRQLVKRKGYGPFYEWIQTEHDCVRKVEEALSQTMKGYYYESKHSKEWAPHCFYHPLNHKYLDLPYNASVDVTPAKIVTGEWKDIKSLLKIEDVRLLVHSGRIELPDGARSIGP